MCTECPPLYCVLRKQADRQVDKSLKASTSLTEAAVMEAAFVSFLLLQRDTHLKAMENKFILVQFKGAICQRQGSQKDRCLKQLVT